MSKPDAPASMAAIASAIVWFIVKLATGGRVSQEVEEEGIDINEHGERAYNL